MIKKSWLRLATGFVVVCALVLIGRAIIKRWYDQTQFQKADAALVAREFATARALLFPLAQSSAPRDEVLLHLGNCERALGNPQAALDAWSRIPPASPFAAKAGLLSAEVLTEQGRWSEAESILLPLVAAKNAETDPARFRLAWLYHRQLRLDDAARQLEALWPKAPDRSGMLRQIWMMEDDPTQFEGVRIDLERAAALAPRDDRVWLGRANLAVRAGRFDQAKRLLDDCVRSRPDDPAVWEARLAWARATDDADEAVDAMKHLEMSELKRSTQYDLASWLAARSGDQAAERKGLEAWLAAEPNAIEPLERLAVLAARQGKHEEAAIFRRREGAANVLKDRYRQSLRQPPRPGEEPTLARMAEQLGRPFEALGWWTVACSRAPDNAEYRKARDTAWQQHEDALRRSRAIEPLTIAACDVKKTITSNDQTSIKSTKQFTDDAARVGLAFRFENGASPARQLPETMSGGIGVLDFDGDGWLDVYAVQGGAFPSPAPSATGRDRLFRNRRDGTFEDVTERAGLDGKTPTYGHGVAVGDFDNDGHPDLFRTGWRSYLLLRNRGDGTFEDVTARVGLGGDRDWPTSAAFADLDGDGDLDLYVCHYLAWNAEQPRVCPDPAKQNQPTYCAPRDFAAMSDHLFRNDNGRFVDITAEAGIVDHEGRGLGVVAADLDDDGRVDLFVANDTTANYLFRNRGGMRFEEVGLVSGVAASSGGGFQAGMGVACGDQDGDGRPDLVVTNFYGESASLFRNLGCGFTDANTASGLAAPTRFLLGFGVVLLDADNDGRLDLALANGHVNDYRPSAPYAMPARLLRGLPGGRLTDISAQAGAPWTIDRVGRGLASADLDNDGAVDLLLVDQNGPMAYLHNQMGENTFISFVLEGTRSNRDAVGARVTVTAGGRRQVGWRLGGGSYLSASDSRLHFGLAHATKADLVEIRWPSGYVDRFENLPANGFYRLREGKAEAKRMNSKK